MYSVGFFATGRGQGSRGLLTALHEGIRSGHVPARIAFVFSNREPGEFEATDGFFKLVQEFGYTLVTSSFRKFRSRLVGDPDWRLKYEMDAVSLIEPYRADLCVLAGFLLVVPELCRRLTMVNLHPAAPSGPVGMWNGVIWQLIESRASTSGNTVLHVTEELDRGPTVAYSRFAITGPGFDEAWRQVDGRRTADLQATVGEDLPLFKQVRSHGVERERPLVVETVKAFAEGRVGIRDGTVVDAGGSPIDGLDLTREIEASLLPPSRRA